MAVDNETILNAILSTSTADHYGLPVVEIDGCEYAVARGEDEVLRACRKYIEGALWTFNTSFLLQHMNVPASFDASFEEALRATQRRQSEEGNAMIRECIKDIDALVEAAIAAEGAGHFLSAYDGNEAEHLGAYWFQVS